MTSITIKEYYAEKGSRFTNEDAKKIGPVLYEESKKKGITARDVVDIARSSNSPLREYFEWNDVKAADEYRLEQARNMLRSVRVRFIENDQPKDTKAFQVVRKGAYEDEPRSYKSFTVLHGDSAFAANMLQEAMSDLSIWKNKYGNYIDMWDNFSDIFQAVVNQISEFEEAVKSEDAAVKMDRAVESLLKWRTEYADVISTWTNCRQEVQFMLEAILEAEERFGVKGPKGRKCLSCGKPFQSLDKNHRMCTTCRRLTTA